MQLAKASSQRLERGEAAAHHLMPFDTPAVNAHIHIHTHAYKHNTGHRVCCLAASPTPQGHCLAVLRKLGVDRSTSSSGAFAYLPLLGRHCHDSAADAADAANATVGPVLQRAADFFKRDPPSGGGGGGGGGGSVLVLDDVSLVAGVLGARAAVEVVQRCRALLQSPAMAVRPSSLLVRAMDDVDTDAAAAGHDDGGVESVSVLPLLLRLADALLEVRPLASGYSRDVHGLVRVRTCMICLGCIALLCFALRCVVLGWGPAGWVWAGWWAVSSNIELAFASHTMNQSHITITPPPTHTPAKKHRSQRARGRERHPRWPISAWGKTASAAAASRR
jgi:hypothetical protein